MKTEINTAEIWNIFRAKPITLIPPKRHKTMPKQAKEQKMPFTAKTFPEHGRRLKKSFQWTKTQTKKIF